MPDWPAFAGFTGVVLAILLVLARISQAALDEASPDGDGRPIAREPTPRFPDPDGSAAVDPDESTGGLPSDDPRRPIVGTGEAPTVGETGAWPARDDPDADAEPAVGAVTERGERFGHPAPDDLTTGILLANVAVSQGLLGSLLLAAAWYTEVPAAAVGAGPAGIGPGAAAAGVGLGVALYAANEAGAVVGRRVGFSGGEELREALAPETPAGWAALLFVVLPIVAGFEELLFRGALIGAMHAGFGVSPWILAGGSSVAFAAGHGAQGRIGMTVTGVLGFVLAAAFVLTGSLLTAVVAHYLVNALEFLVHEWAGIDPAAGPGRPGD